MMELDSMFSKLTQFVEWFGDESWSVTKTDSLRTITITKEPHISVYNSQRNVAAHSATNETGQGTSMFANTNAPLFIPATQEFSHVSATQLQVPSLNPHCPEFQPLKAKQNSSKGTLYVPPYRRIVTIEADTSTAATDAESQNESPSKRCVAEFLKVKC
jgi:hypothetical protein